jgi:transposase-like protein
MGDRYECSFDPNALVICHKCKFDLRAAITEQRGFSVEANEVDFQHYLIDALRQDWIYVPENGFIYSHLFFFGIHHIVSRLIDGKSGRRLQESIIKHFRLTTSINMPLRKHAMFERLGVAERQELLSMVYQLLKNWPDGFIEFSKLNKVWSHVWLWRRFAKTTGAIPYWFWRVVHENLTIGRYSVSEQEITSVFNYLTQRKIKPNREELSKYLPCTAIERGLQAKGFVKKKVINIRMCPYCKSRTRHQKAGQSRKGAQKFRCMACNRIYNPTPAHRGYPNSLRRKALRLYQKGNSFNKVARELSVSVNAILEWHAASSSNSSSYIS